MQAQSSQKKQDQWIKPFFKEYRSALILALFLGLATFFAAGALMFTSGYLISRAAEMPGNIMMIYLPTVFARVFGVGKPFLHYAERLTSHTWVLNMTSKLRLKLYTTLEKDAIFFRRSHKTGDILGLLAEDIGHIQNLYLRTIFPTVIAWLLYLLIIIGLGYFSLWFALVMLLMLAVTIFLVPLVSVLFNKARQTRRKAMKNELYGELTDNVLGVSDWVFAQRGHEYLNSYKDSEKALRAVDFELNRSSRRRDLVVQILFSVIVCLLLLWSGSYFGGSHGGAANWIAAFVLGFFPLIDAFTPLSSAAVEASTHRDSIDRLNDLPSVDKTDTVSTAEDLALPLTIQIKNMTFGYPHTTRPVLKNLDLTITQGERIAILGRSGSGKSTLASLIRGDLKPSNGSVLLNDISPQLFGDNIARYIGVIQQQTYLFNMTLRDNLKIGKQTASDDELWSVLDKVGLKDMAERLPESLDTLVDEAGMRFSGGERHRIALARVLLQDVPIVILDEPTVGLDPLTERDLLKTVFQALEGKTLIMITHHLQGVSLMDRVIFIEDGGLKINGSPSDLEKNNAHYQKLQTFDIGLEYQ